MSAGNNTSVKIPSTPAVTPSLNKSGTNTSKITTPSGAEISFSLKSDPSKGFDCKVTAKNINSEQRQMLEGAIAQCVNSQINFNTSQAKPSTEKKMPPLSMKELEKTIQNRSFGSGIKSLLSFIGLLPKGETPADAYSSERVPPERR